MIKLSCGCSFKALPNGRPDFNIFENPKTNVKCPLVWDAFAHGKVKGVFQLGDKVKKKGHIIKISRLGTHWCKRLKPENLENLGALIALLRPGCISGDTIINDKHRDKENRKRRFNGKTVTIRDLYQKFQRNHYLLDMQILSVDEKNLCFLNNKVHNIIYSGDKPVFKVNIRTSSKNWRKNNKFYNLECTDDHKLLTHDRGWVELKDLRIGERIAVRSIFRQHFKANPKLNVMEKHFRDLCWQYYEYRCIMCDWSEGSLDVNHLEGNRKTNNRPDNLCFFCPNHHRLYSENKISKEEAIKAREKFKLKTNFEVAWVEFVGKTPLGIKDTYDITMAAPHHNFLAGNFVVHNCLTARDEEGISITEHYCRRKNKEEEPIPVDPALEDVLKKSYGMMAYQEELLKIAEKVSGFDLVNLDKLRGAVGKKIQSEMAQCKIMFIEGASKTGIVNSERAERIWGMIEKSGRYLFNKSHSASYGLTSFDTMYLKVHFPAPFFMYSIGYADFLEEVEDLVEDSRYFGVTIEPPDIRDRCEKLICDDISVRFGLGVTKGIGPATISNLIQEIPDSVNLDWYNFLCQILSKFSLSIGELLIKSGSLRFLKKTRNEMLFEWKIFNKFTKDTEMKWVNENYHRFTSLKDLLCGAANPRKEGGACANCNRVSVLRNHLNLLENPPYSLEDAPEWIIQTEKNLLGVPLTYSPMDLVNTFAATCTIKEYQDGRSGELSIAGEIKECNIIKTKKGKNPGQNMAFLALSDNTGRLADIVVFPDVFSEFSALLFVGSPVLLIGERGKNDGFIVKKVCGLK